MPPSNYVFGITAAVLAIDILSLLTYLSSTLQPWGLVLFNIAAIFGWCGCLAVFFFCGGGLYYTGPQWVGSYISLLCSWVHLFATMNKGQP